MDLEIHNKRVSYFWNNCGCDYILETNFGNNFTEIVSSIGGDINRDRVYGDNEENFKIYAK